MNEIIFFSLYDLAHQTLFFDRVVVFFANTFQYFVVLSAIFYLLIHHEVLPSKNPFGELKQKWKEIVLAFLSGVSAWLIAHVIKLVIQSDRPFVTFQEVIPLFPKDSFAFPSGHATFFMALAFTIFLNHKKAGYVFMFCALLIGLARIIAGVHFPIDILGGYVLGMTVAYLVRVFYLKKLE